jgi:hypothetical protein
MERTLPRRIVCEVTYNELPIEGIAIRAILETDFKNNYSSIFGPTDKDGKTQLTQDNILHDAAENWKMGLMDFGPIKECFTGRVFLQILNTQELEGALSAYKLFKDYVEFAPCYQKLLEDSKDALRTIETKKLKLVAHSEPEGIQLLIEKNN